MSEETPRHLTHLSMVTSEVLEEVSHILPQFIPAAQQSKVGVDGGGAGVVVTGADVHVAAQAVIVLTDDHDALAVSLETHKAVRHVTAGILKASGEGDTNQGLATTREALWSSLAQRSTLVP